MSPWTSFIHNPNALNSIIYAYSIDDTLGNHQYYAYKDGQPNGLYLIVGTPNGSTDHRMPYNQAYVNWSSPYNIPIGMWGARGSHSPNWDNITVSETQYDGAKHLYKHQFSGRGFINPIPIMISSDDRKALLSGKTQQIYYNVVITNKSATNTSQTASMTFYVVATKDPANPNEVVIHRVINDPKKNCTDTQSGNLCNAINDGAPGQPHRQIFLGPS